MTRDWNAGVFTGTSPSSQLRLQTVLVSTTVTALPASPLAGRTLLRIWNPGATNVYLTDASGSAASPEMIIYPSQIMDVPITEDVTLYGIVAAGTQNLKIWEFAA